MNDITERLRVDFGEGCACADVCVQAADEIERLRTALHHEQTTCRREGCEPYRLLLQRATDAESSAKARIERGLRHV